MVDWDEDSPRLRSNLVGVLRRVRDAARRREELSAAAARRWHSEMMDGLVPPDPVYAGAYRGERALEDCQVCVGRYSGVEAANVARALAQFEAVMEGVLVRLDQQLLVGAERDADQVDAILDAMGWAHAEWVRIHPFVNGNGRTARLWANAIAMRYGLPPFVRLRPRPNDGYGSAGEQAMTGSWEPTATVFRRMLARFLDEAKAGAWKIPGAPAPE